MYTNQHQRTFGELEAYEIRNADEAPLIILFHGYGADAFDLMPLSQLILPDTPANWLFPQGLHQIDIGFGMQGRAWFPIDVEAFQRATLRGEYSDLSRSLPQGFAKARAAAAQMLAALEVPMNRIILGGFSQGAMLATDLTLRADIPPAALLILSGTLLNADDWRPLAPKRAGLPFFQSHGKADPLLPHALATELNKLLTGAGLQGTLHSFDGGHEIPQSILLQLKDFINPIIEKMAKKT